MTFQTSKPYAAQKAARLAVLASPWQGMSDTELMAGVVIAGGGRIMDTVRERRHFEKWAREQGSV